MEFERGIVDGLVGMVCQRFVGHVHGGLVTHWYGNWYQCAVESRPPIDLESSSSGDHVAEYHVLFNYTVV